MPSSRKPEPPTAMPPERAIHRMSFVGNPLELLVLYISNLFLSIITLGIYSFWGRTRIRYYLMKSSVLLNDSFEYHGKGAELFVGFLKAVGLFILIIVLYVFLGRLTEPLFSSPKLHDAFISLIFYFTFFFLAFYGLYRALRYRASRISWRHIRFFMNGSASIFAWLCIKRTILNVLTLGLLIPKSTLKIYGYIFHNLHFGNHHYRFRYDKHNLLMPHIISWLLFIPTLGMARVWYWVKLRRFVMEHLSFMDIKFKYDCTTGQLIWLYFTNLLIIVFTLGLGIPFVIYRTILFNFRCFLILGDIEKQRISMTPSKKPQNVKGGEGINMLFGDDGGIF